MINRGMNPLTTITNQISKQTCAIKGVKPADNSVVYAAECTKHTLIYIGKQDISSTIASIDIDQT